jgi:hypothetical protein
VLGHATASTARRRAIIPIIEQAQAARIAELEAALVSVTNCGDLPAVQIARTTLNRSKTDEAG